jgi:uncharacterized membrane protein
VENEQAKEPVSDDVRLNVTGEESEEDLKKQIAELRSRRSSMIQRRKSETKAKKERKQQERKEKSEPII